MLDQQKMRKLWDTFARLYGEDSEAKMYFAPGRVNLIGEHIDYSGGHVLPCALTLGTYGIAKKREDDKVRLYSENLPEIGVMEYALSDDISGADGEWTDYVRGVIWTFAKAGMGPDQGMDILIYGDLPTGAGLSSSASLEVLTGYMLRDMYGYDVTDRELAILAQRAEREYCGVHCGIMDQFAVAMGKAGYGIYLDTSDLSYEYIPVSRDDVSIVIADSNKPHDLKESKYNERRKECEKALDELQAVIGINYLCDLDEASYDLYKVMIKDEIRQKRAHHAVYENARVKKAAKALKKQDMETFGELMYESHRSMSKDYQVTGEVMDALVAAASREGVLGSRMTGGGFGGSTVSLVKTCCVPDFIEETGKAYTKSTGLVADFYVVEAGAGPTKIDRV